MFSRIVEEVMQQKAPGVPSNIKLLQHSKSQEGRSKSFTANFFKATFSSRSKAVPAAYSTTTVEEITKIGSAETKPVTRNRPRTAPQESTKAKVKRSIDRLKPITVKRIEKPAEPERPNRGKPPTPDPGEPKPVKETKKNDLKGANVVLQIVKKAHAPAKPPAPRIDSVLPPTLRPKVADKTLKVTKNINNNDVWTNANVPKSFRKRITSLPVK